MSQLDKPVDWCWRCAPELLALRAERVSPDLSAADLQTVTKRAAKMNPHRRFRFNSEAAF